MCLETRQEEDLLGNRWVHFWIDNHHNSNGHKSCELGKVWLTMLLRFIVRTRSQTVSATLYTISLTIASLLVLAFLAQRKTHGWCSPRVLWLAGDVSCDCTFWDERGGKLTRQPVGSLVDAAAITIAMNKYRLDSGRFSSRCYTFWRTHTSADPIRLLCISLALHLTFFLPSRSSPSAKLMVGVSPRTLWLAGLFRVTVRFRAREKEGLLNNQPTGGYSNYDNFDEQKSHGHKEL